MTDNQNTNTTNNFMSVVMGTLVGYAAGVITMIFADDKKRKHVVKISQKVLKDIKEKATDVSDTAEEKLDEQKGLLSDKLKKAAKSLKDVDEK